jgi:transcriptional regulator with XRE-family HTH domain
MGEPSEPEQLHRVRTVRLQQEVSLRTAARHMESSIPQVRVQEQETSDVRITDLHRWQEALDVPLAELLEESDEPLSPGVQQRAQMIRVMKTAAALQQRAETMEVAAMAEALVAELVEAMPGATGLPPPIFPRWKEEPQIEHRLNTDKDKNELQERICVTCPVMSLCGSSTNCFLSVFHPCFIRG